jgi:N utilization substance protein B
MSDARYQAPLPGKRGRAAGRPANQPGVRKAAQVGSQPLARVRPAGLYQHLVGRNEASHRPLHPRPGGLHKADSVHYDALLHGCIEQATDLDALILPLLDRKLAEISPIEHGRHVDRCYEFQHCPDVPWRVVLNECIELAKEFGGTDGHKYVNARAQWPGATETAPGEVEADPRAPAKRAP